MDAKYTAIIAATIAGLATVGSAVITTFFKTPAPTVVTAGAPAGGASAAQALPAEVQAAPSARPQTASTSPAVQTTEQLYAQATGTIAAQDAPGFDARKVFEIPSGRTFTITDQNADPNWVRVEFEGQAGYVRRNKDYVVTG